MIRTLQSSAPVSKLARLVLFSALTVAPAFAGGAPEWLRQLAHEPLPTYPSDTKAVELL